MVHLYLSFLDCLKQHSRRSVPEYEIVLAIIHCSTKMYCNPSYKIQNNSDYESESNGPSELQRSIQSSCNQTNYSNPLVGDETEVFIPETDRKSTASTHLTDKSTNNFTASRVDQTNSVTIECQTLEQNGSLPSGVVMSSLQFTESTQAVNKRKRTRGIQQNVGNVENAEMDSDEDELFNFAAKKADLEKKRISPVMCITRQQRKSTSSPLDESASTSAAAIAKVTLKSSDKQLPIAINKRSCRRAMISMSGFLEKSQAPNLNEHKTNVGGRNIPIDNNTSKQGTKRARIAVLDNSDDDDLFCFGGKSNSKEESNLAKRARAHQDCDSDENLFNFGGGESEDLKKQEDVIDVDLNKQSQNRVNNSKSIVMPKPKPLPSKICVSDWLDCSLTALSIKGEQMKDEVDADKRENNDSGVEGDSKENVEPFKGGCVVTTLSTKPIISERKCSKDKRADIPRNGNSNVHSKTKNFKKFVKVSTTLHTD